MKNGHKLQQYSQGRLAKSLNTCQSRTSRFAPSIVLNIRMVAMCPERLARGLGDAVRIVDPPFDLPDNDLSMAWHPRVQSAAVHKWLRKLIDECTQSIDRKQRQRR